MNIIKYMAISCLLLCWACGNKRNDKILITDLIHSQIQFPPKTLLSKVNVVVYVGDGECGVCSLNLPEWKAKFNELQAAGIDSVQFLFIVCKQEAERMYEILEESHMGIFRHQMRVIADMDNMFAKENPIPSDFRFHTFLLDRNNRVVLVGSPIGNPKMWSLYKETIQKLAASGGQLSGNP